MPHNFFRKRACIEARDHGEPSRAVKSAKRRNGINVQVIRSYSWAAAESPKNSQCKPVNNCGGSRDFPETLVSTLKRWQPATDRAADLLRMDLNDLSRRSSLQLIEQVGHASGQTNPQDDFVLPDEQTVQLSITSANALSAAPILTGIQCL